MKRGQGAGLTWFVAFIIIFFLMLIFSAMSSGIAARKLTPIFGSANKIEFQYEKNSGTLEIQRVLMVFLSYPVEFKGKNITIYNLIKENEISNKEASKIFKEVVQSFFGNYFLKENSKTGEDFSWRVRVSEIGREFERGKTEDNFYGGGSSVLLPGELGGTSCNPETDVFTIINIGNKKIALCISKSYYSK